MSCALLPACGGAGPGERSGRTSADMRASGKVIVNVPALVRARRCALDRTLPALVWLGDIYLDSDGQRRPGRVGRALARQPGSAAALFGAGRAALAARHSAKQPGTWSGRSRRTRAQRGSTTRSRWRTGTGQRDKADAAVAEARQRRARLPDPLIQQADVVLDSADVRGPSGCRRCGARTGAAPSAVQAWTRGRA